MGVTTAAVIGIGASAVGAGMSYSAQRKAANTQETFGMLNAQAQEQAAMLQSQQTIASLRLNRAAAKAQQVSNERNAKGMRQQVEAESRVAQENIRRSRDAFSKDFGQMRAGLSESGVLASTGSPLDFLVSASEDQALIEAEMKWTDSINRNRGQRQADIEALQGRQAGLNASLFGIQMKAERSAAGLKVAQARLEGFGAQGQAAGMRAQANAGLVSDIGSTAMSGYNLYQNRTPRTPATPKKS
jgi:hypothetical protein